MGERPPPPTGDELLKVLAALANPHRMRVIEALTGGRNYVSKLAREIGMSRPLLHMHLQRLEAAGLIKGSLELSTGGKATRYFEVTDFAYELSPQAVARAARTITEENEAADGKTAGRDKTPRPKPEPATPEQKPPKPQPEPPGPPEKEDVL